MPRSIALVGASAKEGSVGHGMVSVFKGGAFPGKVYLINPNYREIEGLPCFPSLSELPETVDHAVMGIANARLEGQIAEAIKRGTRAATIFASGYLENDSEPQADEAHRRHGAGSGHADLRRQLHGLLQSRIWLRVCGYLPPPWLSAGPIAFITHSGSAYLGALSQRQAVPLQSCRVRRPGAGDERGRLSRFRAGDAEDDESRRPVPRNRARSPAFRRRAGKGREARDIPVVALKVGRTAESAALALSHSGAMAGNDAAYQALFDRYGVIRVDDLDRAGQRDCCCSASRGGLGRAGSPRSMIPAASGN